MGQAALKHTVSHADYVAAELNSPVKHEWLAGEIFAMAGGTIEHGRLQTNIQAEIRAAIAGRRCSVYSSDVRIRVLATGLSTYPDGSVVCGKLEADPADACAVTNPIVLIEVLSDSSEAYDRGEKFAHYRRIPSLREYVVVSQREPLIEVHRRNEAGRWELFESAAGEAVELASVGCAILVDEVYRNPLVATDAVA